MRTDGLLTRRVPKRLAAQAAWIPHAAVLGAALITFMAGFTSTGNAGVLLSGLLPAVCVAMTLIRPVGAFWMSMVLVPVSVVVGGYEPWAPSVFI
ncbi:two-component sensor histidine kinase, partial [Streptomyces sp. DT225]